LLIVTVVFLLLPLITAAVFIVQLLRYGSEILTESVLLRVAEDAREAIRVRQRRRWEKRQGRHDA